MAAPPQSRLRRTICLTGRPIAYVDVDSICALEIAPFLSDSRMSYVLSGSV